MLGFCRFQQVDDQVLLRPVGTGVIREVAARVNLVELPA